MKNKSFYPKMALSNIKKNRQTYLPFMIMCIFTIMMYYMVNSIIDNESVRNMKSATNILFMLGIGLWVCRIFSVIFLFYINSFLIKRRNKEFGLYNILGMEKRHIGRMMFFETVYIAFASIVAGVIMGIVFSKLMFLLLMKLLKVDAVPDFDIPVKSILTTIIFFMAIFALTLLYNLARVHLSKPIELLRGGQVGEKEPKTKIIMTIIGVLTMGAGYAFALFAKSPLEAMSYFLIAVILVIIGTYALFTAGSIAVIKLLKKNKIFYYKTSHFTSVSGMLYRMKQNAVGLANICVLSTMVLISVATTVSLYIGMEDTVRTTSPKEMNVVAYIKSEDDIKKVDEAVEKINKKYGASYSDAYELKIRSMIAEKTESGEYDNQSSERGMIYSSSSDIFMEFVDIEDFNKMNKSDYSLDNGEVFVYTKKGYSDSDISFLLDGKSSTFKVKESLNDVDSSFGFGQMSGVVDCMLLVVNNLSETDSVIGRDSDIEYDVCYDTNMSDEDDNDMADEFSELSINKNIIVYGDSQSAIRNEFHEMYGGLLFIGMFVGILFLMATTLIIYYKQISEGYDDRERFIIMQKVGMSHLEVKKTIRSQVLMVFFIPLVMSAIHVAVSFRIIKKILNILAMGNTPLYALCTVITVIVFSIIYGIVFSLTAKTYYKIVS